MLRRDEIIRNILIHNLRKYHSIPMEGEGMNKVLYLNMKGHRENKKIAKLKRKSDAVQMSLGCK